MENQNFYFVIFNITYGRYLTQHMIYDPVSEKNFSEFGPIWRAHGFESYEAAEKHMKTIICPVADSYFQINKIYQNAY